jgi:hypothetical protein
MQQKRDLKREMASTILISTLALGKPIYGAFNSP